MAATAKFCRACRGEDCPAEAAARGYQQPPCTICGGHAAELIIRRLRDICRMLRDGDRADAQRWLASTIEELNPHGHAASWMDAAANCLTASDTSGALRCLESALDGPQLMEAA